MKKPREFKHCLIKVPKHRSKYEVYVFDKKLAGLLEQNQFSFLSEDLSGSLRLKKKMMFKSPLFAELIATLLGKMAEIALRDPDFKFHEWLKSLCERLAKATSTPPNDDEIEDFTRKLL